jgi:hypothetical protein
MKLTDHIKNQSKVLVNIGRSQPKNSAAPSWFASEINTNAMIMRLEIRKTGL